MAGNSTEAGRSVTSKITSILLTFTDGNTHTLTEIARLARLPISTAHRLATELAAFRLLERTNDGDYRIGLPLRMIGNQDGHAPSLAERAPCVLEDLSTATRSDARLGVLHGVDVAYLEKLRGGKPVSRFNSAAVLPAHPTAMGKALLAFSAQRVVDTVISRGLKAYTPYTVVAPDRFRRALAITRLNRIAVSRCELDPASSGIAVPVFGAGGTVVAAIEVKVRDLPREYQGITAALSVAARSLSRELATAGRLGRPRAALLAGLTDPLPPESHPAAG